MYARRSRLSGWKREQVEQERLKEKAVKRARAEAAARSAEEERRAQRTAKNTALAEAVFKVMREHYDTEPKHGPFRSRFCDGDGFCDFHWDVFQIQIWGPEVVIVFTSSQAPHARYREVCAAVFSGISGAHLDFSVELMEQVFRTAFEQGRLETEFHGVEIAIRPDSSKIYGCQFIKR